MAFVSAGAVGYVGESCFSGILIARCLGFMFMGAESVLVTGYLGESSCSGIGRLGLNVGALGLAFDVVVIVLVDKVMVLVGGCDV